MIRISLTLEQHGGLEAPILCAVENPSPACGAPSSIQVLHICCSASSESTNHRSKIFRGKKKKQFQKVPKSKTYLLWASDCLHSLYIELGITDTLEVLLSIQEGVYRLCTNTILLYLRDLSRQILVSLRGPRTNPRQILGGYLLCIDAL